MIVQDSLAREQSTKKSFAPPLKVPSHSIPPTQVYCPRIDPSNNAVHVSPGEYPVELQKVRHPETNLHMFSQDLLKRQLFTHNAVLLLIGKSLVQFRIVSALFDGSLQSVNKSP